MRCDNCGAKEATIHLTQMESNQMRTRHLCDACAAEKGVENAAPGPLAPLADFLAQLGQQSASEGPITTSACPGCGLELAGVKNTGRLGCSTCYTHYAPHLRALLRKLHGGTQHAGKVYLASNPGASDRATRLLQLRRDIERSISGEDFERAAALRDQIRRLEAER